MTQSFARPRRALLGSLALLSLVSLSSAAQFEQRPADAAVLSAAGLGSGEVQTLSLPFEPGAPFSFTLGVAGEERTVHVAPHSVRSAGYELRVRSADGIEIMPQSVESTYRGTIEGLPGSLVAVNLFEGQLQGILRTEPGAPWYGVQPVTELVPSAPVDEHLVYVETAVLPNGGKCGGALEVLQGPSRDVPADSGGEGAGEVNPKVCEIAIDSDTQFYQANGSSVTATENDITNVINGVSAIYETTADVSYEITVIYVETTEPDPYSTSDSGGLLDQFRAHWNSQHQADQRDIAHLFTGKNLSGSTIGVAWLNVICNKSQGYGLSQSKFSGSFTFRVGLTAHELGHNWSANHCDGSSTCWIMCSGIGGCAGSVTKFGTSSTNSINNKKASSGCLSTPPPPTPPFITNVSPSTIPAFAGGPVTISGFNLAAVTSVTVGGTVLSAPFGVSVENDTTLTFGPPAPSSFGTVSVTATNAAGTSNSLSLTYVATDPPKLTATGLALTGFTFNWSFGAQPNDVWFLLVALNDNTTFPYLGSNILLNSSLVGSGTLSAVGTGSANLVIPPGASGATVYSQVVLLDGGTLSFEDATNITTSSILQ